MASRLPLGGELAYPNDIVNWKLGYQEVQRNFNPGLGFVNRRNNRRYEGTYRYRIRPEDSFWRTIDTQFEGSIITKATSRKVQSGRIAVTPLKLTHGTDFGDDDVIELQYHHHFEHLFDDFDISEEKGITLAKNERYHWDEGILRLAASPKRVYSGVLQISGGGFFSGERLSSLAEFGWRPNKHWFMKIGYNHNEIWLPEGNFRVQLVRGEFIFQFTPDISWNTIAQWDNETDELGFNSIFRWIIQDGREFFIVFNHDFDTPERHPLTTHPGDHEARVDVPLLNGREDP